MMEGRWLSTKEAAAFLGVSMPSVWYKILSGTLQPDVTAQGTYRILLRDLRIYRAIRSSGKYGRSEERNED